MSSKRTFTPGTTWHLLNNCVIKGSDHKVSAISVHSGLVVVYRKKRAGQDCADLDDQ